MEQQERFGSCRSRGKGGRRSSSRSPSLSRRPSLKEKGTGSSSSISGAQGPSGAISKSKKKHGHGASGTSKKERWLLTRKTWRYMTDVVGNLLPEHLNKPSSSSNVSAISSPTSSGASRRPSSALSSPDHQTGGGGSSSAPPGIPVFYPYPSPSNPIPSAGVAVGSTPIVPAGHGYGRISAGGSGFVYDSTGKPIPSGTARPQSISRSSICGGSGTGYAAPSDDIPTLEDHFDNVCSKEKKFLLWTPTRAKGLSGPALREMKQMKAEEQKQRKELKEQQKQKNGGSLRRKGVPQDLNLDSSDHHPHHHQVSSPPHYRARTSSSSEVTTPRSPESKDHLLDYYSPGEEEILDDEYDEYEHDEEQLTVRECRRKSSTASSIVSIVSSGLSFFRPFHHHSSSSSQGQGQNQPNQQHQHHYQHPQHQVTSPPPHGYDSGFYILTVSGVQKYVRNVGLQTEPFPEELLSRLKLQSAKDEHQQQQLQKVQLHGFVPEETESMATGDELIKLKKVDIPECQGEIETNKPQTQATPSESSLITESSDKKSEESGYSSSISDTVMRYLRMVRKNSKSDDKEKIDKFKTVNYDRSLRYIKSKNVTVEEALEHEKNKAIQAAAAAAAKEKQQQPDSQETSSAQQEPIENRTSTTNKEISVSEVENSNTSVAPPSTGKKKEKSKVPSSASNINNISGEKSSKKVSEKSKKSSTSKKSSKVEKESKKKQSENVEIEGESSSFFSESEPGSRRDSKGECLSPGPSEQGLLDSPLLLQQVVTSTTSGVPGMEKVISSPTSSTSPAPSSPESVVVQGGLSLQLQSLPPASIGIQAGESLIRYLRYLNPRRKFSDFSSAASYCSSESPLDLTTSSPRYSIGTTTGTESLNLDRDLINTFQPSHFQFSQPGDSTGGTPLQQHPDLYGPLVDPTSQLQHSHPTKHYHQQTQAGESPQHYYSGGTGTPGAYDPQHGFHYSHHPGHYVGYKRDSTTSCVSIGTGSSISASEVISSSGSSSARGGGRGHIPLSNAPHLKKSSSAQQITTCDTNTSVSDSSTYSSSFKHYHQPYTTTGLSHHQSYLGLGTGSSSRVMGQRLTTSTSASTPATPSISPNVISKNLSSSAPFSAPILKTSSVPQYTDSTGILKSSGTKPSSSGGNYEQQRSSSSGTTFFSSFRSHSSRSNRDSRGSSGVGIAESLTSFLTRHSSSGHGKSGSGGSSGNKPTQSVTFQGDISPQGSTSYGELSLGGEESKTSSTSSQSTVMQKSKSSSSVFHHIGGISSEKRGSTSSTTGSVVGVAASAAATGLAGTGSRLMSKTNRIFKSRSKSQSRVSGGGTPRTPCSWAPQGKCKWTNVNGRSVTLEPTNILNLSESETETLQQVALAKLQALNLGVDVKIPKEKATSTQKPKRRAYLLKKKALSTGFFESSSPANKRDDGSGKEHGTGGSGLVFGISLSQCVTNDKERQQGIQKLIRDPTGLPSSTAPLTTEAGAIEWATCGQSKRSQNGSSSKPERKGSSESLADYNWAKCKLQQEQQQQSQIGSSPSSTFETTLSTSEAKESWNPNAVPTIVRACINHLEKFGLHTTGIFRVSTSLKRIRQLREEIDGGKDVEFGEEHSPHDVAALLKEFLRDLPEPLLCRDLYQAFLRTQKIRNRRLQLEAVQHLIQLLPPPNRDTLALILKFFSKVVENSVDTKCKSSGEILPGNKMEGYSLATLIAPNILPCMPTEGTNTIDQNATQTKERRESIDVVNYMITNYKELFEVSPELLDEVYVHMMDSHPELVEEILRAKTGDDGGLVGDDFETTSSVFEDSECGEILDLEPIEINPPTVTTTTTKKLQKREDILHKDGGKGGQVDSSWATSTIGSKSSRKRDERDGDKQSGGESDSSSTKSSSRWFHRRSRADSSAVVAAQNKTRTSSDSGSEKFPGCKTSRRDSSALKDGKRASSLDSVNLKESSGGGSSGSGGIIHMVTATTSIPHESSALMSDRQRSSSDQSLKVPENVNRRQSSPVLQSTVSTPGSRVITASLKIPVPMSIDDTDIPYIEEENSESGSAAGGIATTHSLQISGKLPTKAHQQQESHPSAPISRGRVLRSGSTDSVPPGASAAVAQASSQQQQSTLRHTPSSSYTPSPSSSPYHLPSSEASSPTLGFSPPSSPHHLSQKQSSSGSAFPYDQITARFSVSTTPSSALHQSRGSISSSGSSSTNSGATTVVATLDNIPTTGSGLHVISLPQTPSPEEQSESTNKTTAPLPSPDPKNIGRETKGANIAGLIKSKTADFEKFAKEQQLGGAGGSGGGSGNVGNSGNNSGSGSIASNLRLRSQGNIQLKQQFLLRQHERQQGQLPTRSSSSSAVQIGASTPSTSSLSRSSLQRRKASTNIGIPGQKPSSEEQLYRSASSTSAAGGVVPPSRWKRSEIIASRSTGSAGKGGSGGSSATGSGTSSSTGAEKFF